MKVFYQDDRVTLYCGDCVSLFNGSLPTFDHMMTDPPYDPETHEGARSDLRPEYGVRFASLDDRNFSYVVSRVVRKWAISFCSLELLGAYRAAVGEAWVRAGIWDRLGSAPQFSGDRPAQGAEGIAIWWPNANDKRKSWNGRGRRAVWSHAIVRGDERVHETQKPLSLMRELVLDFTAVDDVVFDPYAGSGTTGVAAKACGRRAVLIEQDPARCVLAADRLSRTDVDERIAGFSGAKAKQPALDWE